MQCQGCIHVFCFSTGSTAFQRYHLFSLDEAKRQEGVAREQATRYSNQLDDSEKSRFVGFVGNLFR